MGWKPPVMQARLLSLPKLKQLWCKPVSSPVFRFWNPTSAEAKQEIFYIKFLPWYIYLYKIDLFWVWVGGNST
jgi:hypothetical protein